MHLFWPYFGTWCSCISKTMRSVQYILSINQHYVSSGSVLLAWGHEQSECRPWRMHRASHRASSQRAMCYAQVSYLHLCRLTAMFWAAEPVGSPGVGGGANFFTGKTPWRQCLPPPIEFLQESLRWDAAEHQCVAIASPNSLFQARAEQNWSKTGSQWGKIPPISWSSFSYLCARQNLVGKRNMSNILTKAPYLTSPPSNTSLKNIDIWKALLICKRQKERACLERLQSPNYTFSRLCVVCLSVST